MVVGVLLFCGLSAGTMADSDRAGSAVPLGRPSSPDFGPISSWVATTIAIVEPTTTSTVAPTVETTRNAP
jgi:hypothetical protein